MKKICGCCKKKKDIDDFYKNKSHKDGIDTICKLCSREKHRDWYQQHLLSERRKRRKRSRVYRKENHLAILNSKLKCRYGISLEEKLNMLKQQNFKCLICNKDISNKSCVDHNHETNQIRALLCDNCNTGIGMFEEKISVLESAILYLKRWQ